MLFKRKFKLVQHLLQLMYMVMCLPIVACMKEVPEPQRINSSVLNNQNVLLERTFTPFSAPQNVITGGVCNLDLIGETSRAENIIQISRLNYLPYVGWAALDVVAGAVGQDVTLLLSSAVLGHFAVVANRNQRPDVAKFYFQPKLVSSGFKIEASAANVPAGEYALSVLIETGAQFTECTLNKKVEVK